MLGLFEAFSLKCLQLQQAVLSGHDDLVRVLDRELDPLIAVILSYRATNDYEIHMQLQFLSSLIREDADDQASVVRHSAAMSVLIDRYFSDHKTSAELFPAIESDLGPVQLSDVHDDSLLNETILDNLPDSVAVVTTDYRYLYSNPVNARSHNRKPMALIGRHVSELVGDTRFATRVKPKLDLCFSGETVDYVYEQQEAGTLALMRCRMTPLRTSASRIIGAIVLLQNLSEAAQLGRE